MTLNITKKKIEKVLELFNHPQTRKIRKNRGKKRRRNNKSFNRKNGRKNLATSTLKKRGGHAGHPILNGGQVGVVLGGQVGGKRGDVLKAIVSKLSDPLKTKLSELLSKATEKKKALVAFVKQKLKLTKKTDLNEEINFTDLNDIKDDEFNVTIKDIDDDDKDIDDINIDDIRDEDIEDIDDIRDEDIQELVKPSLSTASLVTNITNSSTITEQPKEGKGTEDQQPKSNEPEQPTSKETKTVKTKESKEIDTSEMLKVALASNYFTQYGILSGMLKINQEKNKDKFNVMDFVQDPKLYAEFCNKMGFQFAEMKEEPVVDDNKNDETSKKPDTDSEEEEEED